MGERRRGQSLSTCSHCCSNEALQDLRENAKGEGEWKRERQGEMNKKERIIALYLLNQAGVNYAVSTSQNFSAAHCIKSATPISSDLSSTLT